MVGQKVRLLFAYNFVYRQPTFKIFGTHVDPTL